MEVADLAKVFPTETLDVGTVLFDSDIHVARVVNIDLFVEINITQVHIFVMC